MCKIFSWGKSRTSKPSKTIQKRPTVQKTVLQRIIQLKNSGIGYRKISKQLKKEGLADISKSTVANIYHQHSAAYEEEIEKQLGDSEEFEAEREKQLRLQRDIVQLEVEKQIHQRIKDLYLQKARMPNGVRQIFNDPKELFDFARCTIGNSEEWRKLKDYGANHNLELEATFHEAVGSLEKYEEEVDQGTSPDLDLYVKFEIESFLYARGKEENAKRLQKKFLEILFSAECLDCGAPLATTLAMFGHPEVRSLLIANENELHCTKCSASHHLLCPGCKTALKYNHEEKAFHCPSCRRAFPLPQPEEKLIVSLPVEVN